MSQVESAEITTAPWQPYRERLAFTLLRTGLIAAAVGGAFAWRSHRLTVWPLAALLAFWPTFGGHWVEVFFLNVLRPLLSSARGIQVLGRLTTWFVGGIVLALGMQMTALLTGSPIANWLVWWGAGLGFIAVELVVHLAMQLGGRPNFYNGRG